MDKERIVNAYCCKCFHVRHATIIISGLLLVTHFLSLYVLTYLSVNMDRINSENAENNPTIHRMATVQTADLVSADDDDSDNQTQPIIRLTNINWWISVFVLDSYGSKLNRYDLSMGVMLEGLGCMVSMLALVGAVKRWPASMIPTMLLQVFDIIATILILCGVRISGTGHGSELLAANVLGSSMSGALVGHTNEIKIILGGTKIFFKFCFLRIILGCVCYLRDLNERHSINDNLTTRLVESDDGTNFSAPPPNYDETITIRQGERTPINTTIIDL